jgi:hypothetical protein
MKQPPLTDLQIGDILVSKTGDTAIIFLGANTNGDPNYDWKLYDFSIGDFDEAVSDYFDSFVRLDKTI